MSLYSGADWYQSESTPTIFVPAWFLAAAAAPRPTWISKPIRMPYSSPMAF